MPLGRANAFLNYFERDILNEEIYYFSAIPSKNENELREYGLAVTGSGIFIAYQTDSKKAKLKEILFAGLSDVNYNASTDVLTVENKELQNMYKASKNGLHRQYVHGLIENVVLEVIMERVTFFHRT